MLWVFVLITLVGVLFFLYVIFFSGDTSDETTIPDTAGGEGAEFTVMLAAAFMAVFGAVGVLGTLSGWDLLFTLGVGTGLGIVTGRSVRGVLRLILRQQTPAVTHNIADLVGSTARVTISVPPGKVGEAIIDDVDVTKYPIIEVTGAALERNDQVQVVAVESDVLQVKRKRRG
jgi:hypothetical protein